MTKTERAAARPTHMVLVNSTGVYVKEREFFVSQGGDRETWGKAWEPVIADSIERAREIGQLLATRTARRQGEG